MAEERQRVDWWHTASLMAVVLNIGSKGRKVSPRECHPMENQRPRIILRGKGLTVLRDVFCKPPEKP